ncbi:metalloregulator ArsR/SmtB family transcription factor [Paenibacillus sp. TRM 82003]|uniref:ArsR/SmtB family transcription factor n=1 Tax=Kineococcus sp. TRM81007 TaxID=2925831 RepID=UPI001F5ACF6F|nr:metalloregulator ArsR/SmtB family transcription factor [Kineococcus sp. TRM81007]MCI2238466.1 metalloregulator ArsR/SmtB family transcription factor [Kineococcus sp. TRM81007]MCI3922020.1 metalloregulator ArsR/SmtB family transcription factor [Paenibacillus sp. TRM 82003]
MSGDVFTALGDPTRRRVLELLTAGERSVGEVVAALREHGAISQPAVSQHLGVLRTAGLVAVRSEGTRHLYGLDASGVGAAREWLDRLARAADPLAPFAQPLDALATEVARGRRARRSTVAGDEPDERSA